MLRVRIILLLVITLCVFGRCSSPTAEKINTGYKQRKQQTVLSVFLNAHNRIVFNAPGEPLDFNNYTSNDSILTKIINIDKPEHIFYFYPMGENVYETGNIILLPGDSVFLKNNGTKVNYSTSFKKYIDSFITVPEKAMPTISFNRMLVNAKSVYDKNEKAIAVLSIDAKLKNILKNFNYQIKAFQISGFQFEKGTYNKLVLDSLYNDLLSHICEIESVNSIYTSMVYNNIIHYNAFKKGIADNDLWVYFDKVDSNILHSSFYEPFMLDCIKGNYRNNYKAMPAIASKLKHIKNPSKFVDTLSALTDILLKTKTDYAGAKKELDQYAGGRFSSFMEETDISHHQQRKIQSLPSTTLADFNNKEFFLQKVIFDSSVNITVLDFWASWCVPCVADYPYLKKVEDNLKGKPIKFISISIDKEEDTDKWISRMKQLKTYKNPNQYRLIYSKDPPIKDFFNMSTIPRYIVIDKNGKILSENFDRPNESGFQRKLEAYLGGFKN